MVGPRGKLLILVFPDGQRNANLGVFVVNRVQKE